MIELRKVFAGKFVSVSFAAILFIHLVLSICGFHVLNIDVYYQLVSQESSRENFFQSLFYFHSNPPGLSLLFYLLDKISFGNKYVALEIILPLLHGICFLVFSKIIERFRFRYRRVLLLILFFNPLLFIYFRYPFYSTFIFVNSTFLVYVIFSEISREKKLICLAIILSFNSFFRASWHIFIIIAFLLPFFYKTGWKHRFLALLICCAPLSIYVKNYFVFGKFVSSTWVGMNLMRGHFPLGTPNSSISKVYPFSKLKKYDSFIDEKDPYIQKFSNIPSLNRKDFNNCRYILISDMYSKDFKKNIFAVNWFRGAFFGYLAYLESPAWYEVFFVKNALKPGLPIWCYDYFDLPPITMRKDTGAEVNFWFSMYTIMYSCLFLFIIFHFRKMSFEWKWLCVLLAVFTALYCMIDPTEANRMRMELEPVFYVLIFYTVDFYFRSHRSSIALMK